MRYTRADLPATRHWSPGVVATEMDGDVRVCRMADGQEGHERISDIEPERRSHRHADQLTGMLHRAFQQSLESLRRFVEHKLSWDAGG